MPAQATTKPSDKISSVGQVAKTLADVLLTQGALDETKTKQIKLSEIQTGKSQEEIIKSQNGSLTRSNGKTSAAGSF